MALGRPGAVYGLQQVNTPSTKRRKSPARRSPGLIQSLKGTDFTHAYPTGGLSTLGIDFSGSIAAASLPNSRHAVLGSAARGPGGRDQHRAARVGGGSHVPPAFAPAPVPPLTSSRHVVMPLCTVVGVREGRKAATSTWQAGRQAGPLGRPSVGVREALLAAGDRRRGTSSAYQYSRYAWFFQTVPRFIGVLVCLGSLGVFLMCFCV